MSHSCRLRLLAGFVLCLALIGCGRKGPLFLPEQKLREHLPPAQQGQPTAPPSRPSAPTSPTPSPTTAP